MEIEANVTRHGLICHYQGDEVIGASLRLYGEWAEQELYLLHNYVKPGATVLDIGANVGTHSLAFSQFVTQTGHVVAVDGQRRAFDLLLLNMQLNGAQNVSCVNAIVDKTEGLRMIDAGLRDVVSNLGAKSFAHPETLDNAAGSSVRLPTPQISLDSLQLDRCDLIKIDVEGMEMEVLSGASDLIRRHRPVLYFEQASGKQFAEIFEFLSGADYKLWWHVADPFNRNNFSRHGVNIFGGSKEVNVLGFPAEREGVQSPQRSAFSLQPIDTPAFDPPVDTDVTGWLLADENYWRRASAGSSQTFLRNLSKIVRQNVSSSQTFLHKLSKIGRQNSEEHASEDIRQQHVQLQQDFDLLQADRIKAQSIMEYLANRIKDLEAQLAATNTTPR